MFGCEPYYTPNSACAPDCDPESAICTSGPCVTLKQTGAPISYSGYDVLGDNVVWSVDGPDADGRVFGYRISTGERTPLSSVVASTPKLDGDTVVWATHPFFNPNPDNSWRLVRYNLGTGSTTNLVNPFPAQLSRPFTLAGGNVAALLAAPNSPNFDLFLFRPLQ